jgi:phosphoribosylformimino-5-aminoimidazole carboxamide ribonucleotide (ProFAR) isomerase
MQVIPAVDLLGNDAVRLERGRYDRVLFRRPLEPFVALVAATDPPLIHVVDLDGARDGVLREDQVARCALAAGGVPLQVSGGLRSIEAAERALAAGAARVVIGTALWESEGALARFVAALGSRLVAALDVRGGRVAVRGWTSSVLELDEALAACVDAGVARLHVTAIERDGTMTGPDLALYERVCAAGPPVVAAGGVRDESDLAALEAAGCEGAVMGVGYLARLGIEAPDQGDTAS